MNEAKRKKKVLVVDDNQDLADTFGKLIRMLGEEVMIVYRGAAALEAAPEFHPDIVFLDIAIPDMDGYETVERLRGIPELKETKFIAVTGFGQEEYRNRSRKAGFDEYIVKPIEMETLQKILKGA